MRGVECSVDGEERGVGKDDDDHLRGEVELVGGGGRDALSGVHARSSDSVWRMRVRTSRSTSFFFRLAETRRAGGGEAIGVSEGAPGGLVEDGEGVGGEDVLGGPDAREASANVVGGVVGEEASRVRSGDGCGSRGSGLRRSRSLSSRSVRPMSKSESKGLASHW